MIPGFKPLGGFRRLKESTPPSHTSGTATQLNWGGADGSGEVPSDCPSCCSCPCALWASSSSLRMCFGWFCWWWLAGFVSVCLVLFCLFSLLWVEKGVVYIFLALLHSGSVLLSTRVMTWMCLGWFGATRYWALLLFLLQRTRENSMYYFAHYLRSFSWELVEKQLCMKKYLTPAVIWLVLSDPHLISQVPNCLTSTWCRNKISKWLVELGRETQRSSLTEVR